MEDSECLPLTVEGNWSSVQSKTVKNKLLLYFQSKKKSGGGECRVEVEEEAPRASVFFRSEEGEFLRPKAPLSSDSSSVAVLENVSESMSQDLLQMLVETICGVEENDYSLEIIWESNTAVVTFNIAKVKFFSIVPYSVKNSVEKCFTGHSMCHSTVCLCSLCLSVVKSICVKEDHDMRSISVKLYPYYDELGTALYGKERPAWKMPDPIIEKVQPQIWKFLQMKKMLQSINDQMRPHFCSVDLERPDVKLSPLSCFLRQKGLTGNDIDNWAGLARAAFCKVMSEYSAFECDVNAEAWKTAEREVCSIVKEDALVDFDPSREVVTIACRADDMKKIRAPVENFVLKLMSQIERETKSITESMDISPAYYYILVHEGLQKAALDISNELKVSYNEGSWKLSITGLTAEVYKTKSWILEKKFQIKQKPLSIPPGLLEYLRTVDSMDMSKRMFTSLGISAIYDIDQTGIFLLGSSDRALADAESKMKKDLSVQNLDVRDQEVLKRKDWMDLCRNLLDTYNVSNKKTVIIWIDPERRDKVTVVGFTIPVKEVSLSLRKFIDDYSHVREIVRVESCAVAQFIERKKEDIWSRVAKDYKVSIMFDPERPKITISGAHVHVQTVRSHLMELSGSLFADTLTVDKPGAKKYFQSQGSIFLTPVMTEFSCVVMLQPDVQDDEEEEEWSFVEETGLVIYCKVRTANGVLVSVSRGDICSLNFDAVVNAANEDLQHIGGLALALLKAAGPKLQTISDDYVAKYGKVRPGEAIVTEACNLPCKYVIHAVGPRYSEFDKNTAIFRLKSAVKECLKQAKKNNCSTIALPAISSGVFGFPVELCTETIAQAVREYCSHPLGPGSITEIHLVDNNDATVRVMAAAVNKEFIDLGPTMTLPQQAGGRMAGTDVIVNSVAENMNLNQGAVAKAISEAAGENLQMAILTEAGVSTLQFGDVVITDGFNLQCQKVFHAVCPFWSNGARQAEKELTDIISYCLEEAEKQRMKSLSFPALGTGNLSFPKDVVSKLLLKEIHLFSRSSSPRFLKEVVIVVHPSDQSFCSMCVFCVSASASFSTVSSPSLGVYKMQMGQLTLEVSSGDITKEACDVIVNSSNQNFNLQAGVSKAILDSAGPTVLMECAQMVNSPGYTPRGMIMTTGGLLPSRNIIHVVGQNDAVKIKEIVQAVLKLCEENKFSSVAFPALGTGVSPSAVADAMVGAVVDFVRKKHPKFVSSVKVLIFQTAMITDFHNSMKKRQGEEVEEKSIFNQMKDSISSFFGFGTEERIRSNFVLEKEEFEPAVFQLCAGNQRVRMTTSISDLILLEQAQRTIDDQYINQLSQEDIKELNSLQKKLTVSIRLERGREDQEPRIQLEGLTRDVLTAESDIRSFLKQDGSMESFDIHTNLQLEEAFEMKQSVKIKIKNETFSADPWLKRAASSKRQKQIDSFFPVANDAPLPQHWEDMKDIIVKRVPLTAGSQEYKDVVAELTNHGLIERIQNTTLWQSYQLQKKLMEVKNKHTNNEKLLYHGTGATSIDLINSKGFNRSYAGAHGAMYGNGSYFAVDPAYSARGYAKPDNLGHKRMYQARVLIGDYTRGKSGLIAPPAKSGTGADLYDSVTDNANNPSMFIIFHDTQAYPEYLITFT
uniref:Poly [ADP-ribose] polymerase n=1 Tax=Cyprinodon variegatus TaxID=28743 RepID=A0A3Q2E0U3_CYPVA